MSNEPGHGTLEQWLVELDAITTVVTEGRVRSALGTIVRATLPEATIGAFATLTTSHGTVDAKVVGFAGAEVVLVPLGDLSGLKPGAPVVLAARRHQITVGTALIGRVLDGQGHPMDGKGPVQGESWAVTREAPQPLLRKRIHRAVHTEIPVLDGMLTLGHGQRVALFAGPGVGKSTLLGQLARCKDFDVVVLALVGERGREVREFIEEGLGAEGLSRSVVVVTTSDSPAQTRVACAEVATSIAEYFRDRHQMNVLLCVDSLSRVARAQREVGLAAGEPPVRQGYPPSLSGLLSRLLERAGNSEVGSITACYSVLTEAGQLDDPVADEVSGLLDGHIVLSKTIAERGIWPAVDILRSLSRLQHRVASEPHWRAASAVRKLISTYESKRDLVELGAYTRGDEVLDEAIERWPELIELFNSGVSRTPFDETIESLREIADV